MIKIDVKELHDVLAGTPPEQNIMLVGRHGIGKSRILTEYYQTKRKMKVVAFFLGQMSDPGDLIGLMTKDEKTGHSEFLPPYWWPLDNKPVVLFLDELNRARPEILQSVMDLTLNKTLAGKKLPPGSIVISAVNSGDEYQLTDLDPALVSRFNVYEFAPTVEDWLLWANSRGIDKRVISFIQKENLFLDGGDAYDLKSDTYQYGIEKKPDRRAWERVSEFVKNIKSVTDSHVKIISGIVGVSAAINFKKNLDTKIKLSAEDILFNFKAKKAKLKTFKLQEYIFLNEQIIYFINNGNYDKKELLLENFTLYIKHLKKEKFNEAVAHLASMFENPKFEKVAAFVLVESMEIMEELSNYISGIDL
ncbi:MAG: AAA domain-containing protein [bacterium]|nr:AAA domain-containing protein [bacterium]